MSQSPGHQRWPEHRVREKHLDRRVRVAVGGEIVADSSDVIAVEEDGHPARYYFPPSDVQTNRLERTDATTECPFKGMAHYYSLDVDGRKIDDAVWSYEDPYDEHQALRGRLAFYAERIPDLEMRM